MRLILHSLRSAFTRFRVRATLGAGESTGSLEEDGLITLDLRDVVIGADVRLIVPGMV